MPRLHKRKIGVVVRSDASTTSLTLSILALAVAGITLLAVLLPASRAEPPLDARSALASYDLSTPRAAFASFSRMRSERDLRAVLALGASVEKSEADSIVAAHRIVDEMRLGKDKLLFVEYSHDGKTVRKVLAFAFDASLGIYLPTPSQVFRLDASHPVAVAARNFTSKGNE